MKNTTPVILLIGLTGIYSCSNITKTIAKFEITNSTNLRIDSLYIRPDNFKNHFLQIEANSKSIYYTDMTDLPKVDGAHLLSYQLNGATSKKSFGYYTNGYPSESLTRISIFLDTVLIKQEYKTGY